MKKPTKRALKVLAAIVVALLIAIGASGCSAKSDTVSKNLSKDADQFKVLRQIVVYNSFTDKYILEVEGFCSLGNDDPSDEVTYTCKTEGGYIKDIIKKSDNTFVYVHQLLAANVSDTHYKVFLRPATIIPDIDVQ